MVWITCKRFQHKQHTPCVDFVLASTDISSLPFLDLPICLHEFKSWFDWMGQMRLLNAWQNKNLSSKLRSSVNPQGRVGAAHCLGLLMLLWTPETPFLCAVFVFLANGYSFRGCLTRVVVSCVPSICMCFLWAIKKGSHLASLLLLTLFRDWIIRIQCSKSRCNRRLGWRGQWLAVSTHR